jgi:hypothetical protein
MFEKCVAPWSIEWLPFYNTPLGEQLLPQLYIPNENTCFPGVFVFSLFRFIALVEVL